MKPSHQHSDAALTVGIRDDGDSGVIATPPTSSSSSSQTPSLQSSSISQREKPSFWVNFIAGGMAGTMGAAITCPLEVVKTRLQSSLYRASEQQLAVPKNPIKATWFHMKGVVGLLGSIRREEGIRALWKGLGPNLIGVVPARSIYFAVYSQGKHIYTRINGGQETSLVHMVSAATAGTATAMMTNPIWLVKTRMQLQSEAKSHSATHKIYRNSFHCFYTVIKEEGVRGLYKGLSASLLGLTESTLQFVTYEALKKSMKQARIKAAGEDKDALKLAQEPQWLDLFLAAATAKLGAAILTYPHEVLRTRLRQSPDHQGQLKYRGLVQATRLIYKEEGLAALYGGMTAHLMRVVPNAAILFISYELIMDFWHGKALKYFN